MSFQSKDEAVLQVQLKVQSLVVKTSDVGVCTASGNNAIIDVKETIGEVRCAVLVDDSGSSQVVIPEASRTVSGTQVTLALGVAMTAADSIVIHYTVID